jgi:hypothetical protein
VTRDTFAERLHEATIKAHEIAGQYIEEHLPDRFRYRVLLNSSYDGNPRCGDEVVFPEDGTPEKAAATADMSFEEVVDLLWRDGRIPEWINIQAVDVSDVETIIGLDACGRFTAMDELLYHHRQGCPPFEIHGPAYPPSQAVEVIGRLTGSIPASSPIQKISIHHDPVCRTKRDLLRLNYFPDKVESLEVHGPGITEEMLDCIPALPGLRILKLEGFSVRGRGLAALGRHPALGCLSVRFGLDACCDLSALPVLPHLTNLKLEHLPAEVAGLEGLSDRCPSLDSFQMSSDFMPELAEAMEPFQLGLQWLCLGFPRLPEGIASCAADSVWLCLQLQQPDDDAVIALADRLPGLSNLDLNGSPVTDRILEAAAAWPNLSYLSVVGTAVTITGLLRFMAGHPGIKMHPRIEDQEGLVWLLRNKGLLGVAENPESLPEWSEWVGLLAGSSD